MTPVFRSTSRSRRGSAVRLSAAAGILLALLVLTGSPTGSATRRFYDDDPLARDPETQDASKVQAWDIDLFYDLALNLFARPGDSAPDVRAQNLNTIDELPDSSWFTNRIGARAVPIDEAVRGPLTGDRPGRRHLDGQPAEDRRLRARLHDAGREGGDLVRLLRRPEHARGGDGRHPGREQDLLDARLLAGGEPPDFGPSGPARRSRAPRRSRRRRASRGR